MAHQLSMDKSLSNKSLRDSGLSERAIAEELVSPETLAALKGLSGLQRERGAMHCGWQSSSDGLSARSSCSISDCGCQYTSDACQHTLTNLGITCSMSRTGNCWDNAVMERFFCSLTNEWTKQETFENLEATHLSVFKYIGTFYNPVRLYQTLDYKSPDQFEADHAPAAAA